MIRKNPARSRLIHGTRQRCSFGASAHGHILGHEDNERMRPMLISR
jgi:hypothetical protein